MAIFLKFSYRLTVTKMCKKKKKKHEWPKQSLNVSTLAYDLRRLIFQIIDLRKHTRSGSLNFHDWKSSLLEFTTIFLPSLLLDDQPLFPDDSIVVSISRSELRKHFEQSVFLFHGFLQLHGRNGMDHLKVKVFDQEIISQSNFKGVRPPLSLLICSVKL